MGPMQSYDDSSDNAGNRSANYNNNNMNIEHAFALIFFPYHFSSLNVYRALLYPLCAENLVEYGWHCQKYKNSGKIHFGRLFL